MDPSWSTLVARLETFWSALGPDTQIVSDWESSRRFPELTYAREDRVGSYKARKYKSLLPWILKSGFAKVRLRGSSQSSNLLELSLLLRQNGIEPSYVLEGREGPAIGNGLLSKLVLGRGFSLTETEDSASVWSVPEGGSCPQALAGSLGIAGSVVASALQHQRLPTDIYIDSGTGFTAVALLLGLGFFRLTCRVHIVSMTRQDRAEFVTLLEALTTEYQGLLKEPVQPLDFTVSHPPIGQSFGSTPGAVFEEVRAFAREEGLLVDPLYTAKLSLAYQGVRSENRSALMFVSGGARDLLGFQRPLRSWLENRERRFE